MKIDVKRLKNKLKQTTTTQKRDYKVFFLGPSGVGKTSYMTTAIQALRDNKYLKIEHQNDDSNFKNRLNNMYNELCEDGNLPGTSRVDEDWQFKIKSSNNEYILNWTWQDYRGGLLNNANKIAKAIQNQKSSFSREVKKVITQLQSSYSIFWIIDTTQNLAKIKQQIQAFSDLIRITLTTNPRPITIFPILTKVDSFALNTNWFGLRRWNTKKLRTQLRQVVDPIRNMVKNLKNNSKIIGGIAYPKLNKYSDIVIAGTAYPVSVYGRSAVEDRAGNMMIEDVEELKSFQILAPIKKFFKLVLHQYKENELPINLEKLEKQKEVIHQKSKTSLIRKVTTKANPVNWLTHHGRKRITNFSQDHRELKEVLKHSKKLKKRIEAKQTAIENFIDNFEKQEKKKLISYKL
ncbi:hypothetical protein [Halanaerobacter jeridensis]|uniref:DNA polymerase III delta prime subunit n=1 Tax=Halanaerobacter jeridensis TaxID=706427 RepID=A0A938XTU6_9FIRM|nr:hypothetical protein [Halanaerobacter jeridensis]MBM7557789.1 DNA polymerase III delta prime subunit [Halanaerobacter jeridensis]